MHARTSTQASTLLQLNTDQHRFSPSVHHSCCVCYLPADAGEVPAQWPFQQKGHYTRLECTHLTHRSYSWCRRSCQSLLLSFPSYLVATLWFTRCAPRSLLGSRNCSCPRHAPAHSHRRQPAPVILHLSRHGEPVQRLHFPPPQPSLASPGLSQPIGPSRRRPKQARGRGRSSAGAHTQHYARQICIRPHKNSPILRIVLLHPPFPLHQA